MAYYAALTSLLQTMEQIPQSYHADQQITSLQDKVSRLLLILDDSSQKSSLMIEDLEGKIRDVSYEAEDIIESRSQVLPKSMSWGVSTSFWESISALRNMIPSIQDMVGTDIHGLDRIIDKFESILDDLSSEIEDGRVEAQQPGTGRGEDLPPRNSPVAGSSRFAASNESPPVGLDADLLQLKDRLAGSTSKLDIISIVGMGGIGKTTLARNLYNDTLIERHFDTRAWVVVSQEYHVREMLTGLLDSTRHDGGELQKSVQQLSEVLYKSLKGRRYLIVMDDVWDNEAWDDVRRFFPDDNNGSRVILTTRLSEVALYAKLDSPIHHMSLLSPEASWNLLCDRVFGGESCPFELETIGKKIAESCKGLPLAIVVIGGLLSKGSRTQDYWEYIAENVKSTVTGSNDQFMQILFTSYNSLPHYLKPCFLYMGVFPGDYEILASKLIKLWIAEGFVKPLTPKRLEDVAEDYLNDLLERSLIMVHTRNHKGGIKTCIIHDLLRNLCVKKARDDKFLQIMNRSNCILPQRRSNERRVSIQSDVFYHFMNDHDSSVRTLIYFFKRYSDYKLLSFTMSCRLLRVFDALTIRFFEFPIEIVELVHLRYLAFLFRGNSFPASISKLQKLQTIIALSVQPIYLPPSILKMPQLRHLLFEESYVPVQIIRKNSVVLENLQTVSGITNFRLTRNVLEMMPNLKKMGISYVYDIDTEWSCYEFNNFVYLRQLEKLKCLFVAKHLRDMRSLPINFAFPPNLKRLTLSGCRISWEKMTVIGSLPKLEVLKLKDHAFEGSEWEPNKKEFKELKFLLIHTSLLEHWRANGSHFPKLQHLSLSCCPKLGAIPTEIGDIPTLEMLELYECNLSAVQSTLKIHEEQQDSGNDTLRIRIVAYKRIYDSQQQNTSLSSLQRITEFSQNRRQIEPETESEPPERTNTTRLGSKSDEWDWRVYDGRDSDEDNETEIEDNDALFCRRPQ